MANERTTMSVPEMQRMLGIKMKQSEKDSNGVKWITVYVLHTLQ